MARYRLSTRSQRDLATILTTSLERWGPERQHRYARLLLATFEAAATDPRGPSTRPTAIRGVRCLHAKHLPHQEVKDPVHLVYFRVRASVVEIVRVLHERMDVERQLRPTRRAR